MNRIKSIIYLLLHPAALAERLRNHGKTHDELSMERALNYDMDRYMSHAGVFRPDTRENMIARIIHTYHGLEKGLTMPRRRFNFGQDAVTSLVELIEEYIRLYGEPAAQVVHGIGILKAYLMMHRDYDGKDHHSFWQKIHSLTDRFPDVKAAVQPHQTDKEFYADVHSDFERFARSRHTLRHYCGTVSEDEIKKAVELAMTAPSACNRQPVRVHCISDKELKDKVLAMQSGNRGFGTDADKVLIITGDLSSICWIDERYDIYTNCGIFIMNLCYSLFYHKIAHCILNWSICVNPEKDKALHELTGIPGNEVVAAMITCGRTPEEIDIAESPRRELSDILSFH